MPGPSRRDILIGSATLPLLATGAVAATADELWPAWQAEWRRMEALARGRQWRLTPLRIGPPVNSLRLKAIETELGLPFPTQLRELMLRFSGKVAFGWHMPSHLTPEEGRRLPNSSTFRNLVWDIDHMVEMGIPNFLGWKRDLKDRDLSESPNRPDMWENQVPLADFINGDMLTIDVTQPDGPQPVRYFSHELEGLHHTAVAPDVFTFVTMLSKLGWAGSEQDSWGPFLQAAEDDRRYLSTETEGAQRWFAWLAQDPAKPPPDEPPAAIAAETPAERALLAAAEAGSLAGARAALALGARPDVVRHGDDLLEMSKSEWEFATALTHAVRRDDLAAAEALLERGAAVNTRRLAANDAVARGSLATLRWVLDKGGRARGWRYDRYHPLHTLLTRRIEETPERLAEQRRAWREMERSLRAQGIPVMDGLRPEEPKPADPATIRAMLDLLLGAGADPDAPWDNGLTMLMWRPELDIAERLIAAGADPNRRKHDGQTAMHGAQSADKVRILVRAGGDPNTLSSGGEEARHIYGMSPLLYQLIGSRRDPAVIEALLAAGADPRGRDTGGNGALAWCYAVADFERMRGFGLDPRERRRDGGTLLHGYAHRGSLPRDPAFQTLLDHVLALGIGINETDGQGQTVLHILADKELATPEDVAALLARGADKAIRDRAGRRPFDLARASATELREALR